LLNSTHTIVLPVPLGVPLRDGHCDLGETANRVAPGGIRCDKSQEEVLQFGVSAWRWIAGVQRGDFMGRMVRMVNGNFKNFMKDS
jgi:hypothetical protein